MAADIVVRIGAAQDRSIDAVFADIEKRSQRAFGVVRGESGRGSQQMVRDSQVTAMEAKRAADARLKIERDVYREQSRLNRLTMSEQMRMARAGNQEAVRLSRERTRERLKALAEEERAERAYNDRVLRMKIQAQREANRKQRAEERASLRDAYHRDREIDRFATRTSHRATRFFFPRPEGALGYARRIGGDLMRGAGVDITLAGGIGREREREMAGMGLAQQERIAEGGKSRGGAFWAKKSLEVGESLKVDPVQVTEMIRSFTGKTGDFQAAAEQAEKLASMTLASGANMGEMGSAAGFVYNQLKGMPDAAERTLDVMRGIVGQTAVGAVEMEEYAKQMGRIAANAKMFQGDVSKNILELSALTQLSIAEGGATSGADAARSIAAFANTTSKGARINAFKKQGVELFNETGTQKRPILDIIKDSLIKSKGSIPQMTKMWADTLGQKPIRGLTNAFNEAGGGEKGWQAALEKIKPFMGAQLDKETERRNIEEYQKTTTAKAQEFQNQLDRVTASLANKLLPVMEQLAPKALALANTFSDAVTWAAGNPWSAVMALLGASVARAATESLGRLAIDRAMTSLGGLVLGGGGTAASGGVATVAGAAAPGMLGKAGAAVGGAIGTGTTGALNALGVIGVATASFMITDAILNSANTTVQQSESARAQASNDTYQVFRREYGEAKTPEEREAAVARAKKNLEATEGSRGFMDRLFGNQDIYMNTLNAIKDFVKEDFQKRMGQNGEQPADPNAQRTQQEASMSAAFSQALAGKTINVNLVNPDDIKLSAEAPSGGGSFFFPQTANQ